MDDLAKEYLGRARVARFMLMTSYWSMPSVNIKDKYNLNAVPIVILFNRGKEVKRWVVLVPEDSCRAELDKLVGPPLRSGRTALGSATTREGLKPLPASLPSSTLPPTALSPAPRPPMASMPWMVSNP
jgi:hypothetical protein